MSTCSRSTHLEAHTNRPPRNNHSPAPRRARPPTPIGKPILRKQAAATLAHSAKRTLSTSTRALLHFVSLALLYITKCFSAEQTVLSSRYDLLDSILSYCAESVSTRTARKRLPCSLWCQRASQPSRILRFLARVQESRNHISVMEA